MMTTKQRKKNVWLGGVIWAVALFVAAPTNAQTVNPNVRLKAQSLYDEAKRLMDEKKYVEACSKLEEVTRLIPEGVGARLVLGECYVEREQFARAWVQYGVAEANATMAGKATIAAKAHADAEKLRSKLVMLTIKVSVEARNVSGLSVTWDGVEQNGSSWGSPMPVDLGKHVLQATAPLHRPWSHDVILDEGGISVDERVPMLDPVRVEAKPPVLEPVPPEVKPRPIEPQRDTTVPVRTPLRPWMRPVGFAALGVGAVGFVVGGVLGGVAISRRDASNTEGECKADGFCNARGVELREEMLDFAHVSTAGWITGGVFATSGAILLIAAARPKKDDMKRGNVTWQLGVIPGGMSVQGVW